MIRCTGLVVCTIGSTLFYHMISACHATHIWPPKYHQVGWLRNTIPASSNCLCVFVCIPRRSKVRFAQGHSNTTTKVFCQVGWRENTIPACYACVCVCVFIPRLRLTLLFFLVLLLMLFRFVAVALSCLPRNRTATNCS